MGQTHSENIGFFSACKQITYDLPGGSIDQRFRFLPNYVGFCRTARRSVRYVGTETIGFTTLYLVCYQLLWAYQHLRWTSHRAET